MKKRLAVGGVVLSLLAILGIGTAAYFVTDGKAENKIVTGKVELTLTETIELDDGTTVDATTTTLNGIMPSQTINQTAAIKNDGNQPYWLRVRANVSIETPGSAAELSGDVISFNWDADKWTAKDGWYYYADPVPTGETVNPFSQVTFAAEAGNEYQGCTVNIQVDAEAVQVKNNDPTATGGTVLDVQGWPEATAPVTP